MVYTEKLKTKINNDEFSLLLDEYKRTNNPAIRDEIIIGSQAFIRSIASKYIKRNQTSLLDIDDLICEGNIGLISAIDKYDTSSNVKFTTYANYWINQAIQRSIYSTDKLIRYPENIEVDLIKYNKKINDALINGESLNFSTDEETLRALNDQRNFVYSLDVETSEDSGKSDIAKKRKTIIYHWFGLGSYEKLDLS